MKRIKIITESSLPLPLPLLLLLSLLLPLFIYGQHQISRDVLANGGRAMSSTAYQINGTVGQAIIGFTAAPSGQIEAGFWPAAVPNDSVPMLVYLPAGRGAATAHVWNNQVYFFGGSTDWWAAQNFQEVFRLDSDAWTEHDSIPDPNTWGKESVLIGDEVYLFDGYPRGAGSALKYNLATGIWTELAPSTNTAHWGGTVAAVGNNIYLFNIGRGTLQYSIPDDAWAEKTSSPGIAFGGMRSVVYNDEIYVTGFRDSSFHKYNPGNDEWTQLATPPYSIAGGAMQLFRGKIYYAGGSGNGTPQRFDTRTSVISYDFGSDSWMMEPETISSRRSWMASAIYQGEFFVFGGLDSLGLAVDIVEAIEIRTLVGIEEYENKPVIIPDQFTLEQNYPNPFNPTSTIRYGLPVAADVRLTIHNVLGQRVRLAVSGRQLAGNHQFVWDGSNDAGEQVASGIYFYRLQAGRFVKTRKMTLMK